MFTSNRARSDANPGQQRQGRNGQTQLTQPMSTGVKGQRPGQPHDQAHAQHRYAGSHPTSRTRRPHLAHPLPAMEEHVARKSHQTQPTEDHRHTPPRISIHVNEEGRPDTSDHQQAQDETPLFPRHTPATLPRRGSAFRLHSLPLRL